MMNRLFYLLTFLFLIASGSLSAQAQNSAKCATEDEFQRAALENPSLLTERNLFEQRVADFIAHQPEGTSSSVPRIIPVVVHVVHDCGSENISKDQILDQIRILNEDYRRMNADTNNTPGPFRPVAADFNIEFRMAQKDPQGNCTDGIVRVRSHLTNACYPRNRVKAISYWPSNQYLNIWVVKAIDAGSSAGTVLGYAQFPGGSPSTDGIVVVANYFGSIGTATGSGKGRTSTHEVGHWLGLYHIWGDDNGTCTGSDFVSDTPNSADNVFGCPNFPYFDACTPSGNGIMFSNYMDYTDGQCQNLFTTGQKARAEATLASTRSQIISAGNLTATGTDGTPATVCTPVAEFCLQYDRACAGDSLVFTNCSFNADNLVYYWDFPGGSPVSSTATNPVVTYTTPGTYNVTLTATSTNGGNAVTKTGAVTIYGAPALAPVYSDDFETPGTFPGNEGYVLNPDNSSTYTWNRLTGVTGSSGTSCLRMRNNVSNFAGEIDTWVTPSFDLSNFTSCQLRYKVAYAQFTTANIDALKVYYSTSCGKFWTLRQTKSGATLATTTSLINNFTPTSLNQWRQETVSLGPASGKPNVRFKFEFVAGPDNNLYIDDIEVTGTPVGISEINSESLAFDIAPNPAYQQIFVSFTNLEKTNIEIFISDLSGRIVKSILKKEMVPGIFGYTIDISDLGAGLYFATIHAGAVSDVKKLIVQ